MRDEAEDRRQIKLYCDKVLRDLLDDNIYIYWKSGATKAHIARELGFKNANQLARSFHVCELRERDEEIAELNERIAALELELSQPKG